MKKPLRIIHVEDSEEDSSLVNELLLREGLACVIDRVENREQLVDLLMRDECDLVLSDCTLPHFTGFRALEITSALKPRVPFIFVSGTLGEEAAIESLRNGATDYVLKSRISRLIPAVRRALAETEEKAMRRTLEERLQQARRLQAASTVAGGVAHDIKDILLGIQHDVFMLAKEHEHSQHALELIVRINEASDHGSKLMLKLLAFARQSQAHLTLINAYQHVNDFIGTLKDLLPQSVELTTPVSKELPPLFADPEHINRMLTNLIQNAREALPQGGKIKLSVELVQFDAVLPNGPELENISYISLQVEDDGIGMDEATRLRVFEPFFTTKSPNRNPGMGLPEVFGLMRIHNGLIDIRSEPGRGTIVSLFFQLPRNSVIATELVKRIPSIQMLEPL